MDKLEDVMQIGIKALSILERLRSNNADTVRTAAEEHLELVDHFYRQNYDIIASPQYEVAKMDLAYFLRLVYLTLNHYGKER